MRGFLPALGPVPQAWIVQAHEQTHVNDGCHLVRPVLLTPLKSLMEIYSRYDLPTEGIHE